MQPCEGQGWRASAAYLYVLRLDTTEIAWEYLRRDPRYRKGQSRFIAPRHDAALAREARALLHMHALQALDGLQAGASHKEIACAIFGVDIVAADWHPDSYLRARVRYLLTRAQNIMAGNYRRLVRQPAKFLPPSASTHPSVSARPTTPQRRRSQCSRSEPSPDTATAIAAQSARSP